jgi:hypothetical protein
MLAPHFKAVFDNKLSDKAKARLTAALNIQ